MASSRLRTWLGTLPALGLVVMLAGCGGGGMTLSEYVEEIDEIQQRALSRYEQLVAGGEGQVLIVGQGVHFGFDTGGKSLTDFTLQELQAALEAVAAIQDEAIEAAEEIDPPEEIAELHTLWFRRLPLWELAERAGTATDWDDLSESAEMAAYRNGLAGDAAVCLDFQEKLDATAERGAFSDVPWIPSELTEIADYALGCSNLPANPQDVFRP